MTISAFSGPLVGFGQAPSADYNSERGPSAFDQGYALLDPRTPYTYNPGQGFGSPTCGFFNVSSVMTLNIAPAALGVGAVAAAANVTSGTAMTLVSSSAAGIVIGQSLTRADTGVVVTGLLAVGQAAGRVSFGTAGTMQMWDPTTLTARALSITGASGGSGGAFKIFGYDIYGYPMNETITATSGATTVNGKKAFKYIASVTPQFTDAHNYSVDTTDIFGLPLASTYFGDSLFIYPGSGSTNLVTSVTGYTAGVTTVATATTGDVRGTYALQSASDGTKRLIVYQTLLLPNVALANGPGGTAVTGLFGVGQF